MFLAPNTFGFYQHVVRNAQFHFGSLAFTIPHSVDVYNMQDVLCINGKKSNLVGS